MMTSTGYDKLLEALAIVNQEHLLGFWDQLSTDQLESLLLQIDSVDFQLLEELVSGSHAEPDWAALAAQAESPPAIRWQASDNPFTREQAVEVGERALRDGEVGVVLVAGGQGSRLGFPHPKGMYPLGPVSGRTLFQIHVDRILAFAKQYQVSIPLFLMTSPATHEETLAYFDENNYCGLPPDDLIVFCQGTMPAVDQRTGRLILEEPDKLFLSPDGHGGTLAALAKAGCFADMKRRGIEYLFYFQVDNPMVVIADPECLGYHILARSEMTTQVVAKTDPHEKVGNVVSIEGQLQVIEYSDLPADAADRRNDDGSLAIWAGSIAVHIFDVAFLERMVDQADSLPFHRAHKCVPYIDEQGQRVTPDEPNAIKFERFIFDLLPSAKNGLVVEVDEAEGFAPLKNAAGATKDTEETVQAAMINQHRRWLAEVGAQVDEGVAIEIRPTFALDVDELKEKLAPGQSFRENTYLE